MADVIQIEDCRPPVSPGSRCVVSFIWSDVSQASQRIPNRADKEMLVTEVEGFVSDAFDRGGIYSDRRGMETWFLPWPPLAVRIRHLD